MNILRNYFLIYLVVSLSPAVSWSQSASVSPSGLSRIPFGATVDNPFWQRLKIELNEHPSAGDTIIVRLPSEIGIADTDRDGELVDEVNVEDSSGIGTGYRVVQNVSSRRIVLKSTYGGLKGTIYVHFPIVSPSNTNSSQLAYGQISFSNSREQPISAGMLMLNIVQPRDLNVVQLNSVFDRALADTTTNPQGDIFPTNYSEDEGIRFPDFVQDESGYVGRYGLVSGNTNPDGNNSNDTKFFVWISTNGNLDRVYGDVATPAISSDTGESIGAIEGDLMEFKLKIEDLEELVYYVYITSNLTGDFPLARSRGIRIRHDPVISWVGEFLSDDSDYLDSGNLLDLDTGEPGAQWKSRNSMQVNFKAIDYNDTATVKLYYATADTLEKDFLIISGSSPNLVVEGLKEAEPIDSTKILLEGRDTGQYWNIAISDSIYVPTGDYYIYGVINDGKTQAVQRSKHSFRVRHSPFIALDVRKDRFIHTGGSLGERYYTITWNGDRGHEGDRAIGDSAKISLYYSSRFDYSIPDGAEDIASAAADSSKDTHLIIDGLEEKDDRRIDNQYEWDIWTYHNPDDGGVPREGVDYGIYAIVETDSMRRLVRWNDESDQPQVLQFSHEPFLRVVEPANTFEFNGRHGFDVAWEAIDVDDEASIWVILTSASAAEILGDSTSYSALRSDGISDWLANSEDGCSSTTQLLTESSQQRFSVRPATLVKTMSCVQTSITDGDYYVYVVVDATLESQPNDEALARRAPGRVKITGLGPAGAVGLPRLNLEFLPATVNTGSSGDTVTVQIYPNTGGEEVDLITIFASVDTSLVRLVDQVSGQEGVQPFQLSSEATGMVLRDTLLSGQDSLYAGQYLLDLVYYEQMGTKRYDGRRSLASIQFVTRDTVGSTNVWFNHLGTRKTAFYRDGKTLADIASHDAMKINVQSRGSIDGKIPLQGRKDFSGITTFYLRDRNSFEPISDARFIAANDIDSTLLGIQDSLSFDGRFSLVDIPRGEYQLVVRRPGYLDGQIPSVLIDNGKTVSDLQPTFQMDGRSNPGYLLGGDVTGYVNKEGKSISDNEIDQLDIDYVVAYFGQTVEVGGDATFADIDGDSLVWIADLNMVAANFNSQGVAPVFKASTKTSENPSTMKILSSESNGRLRIEAVLEGVSGMRAYVVRVNYDSETWRWIGAEDFSFSGRQAVFAEYFSEDEVAWASALVGFGDGVNNNSTLASFEFERVGDEDVPVLIAEMEWMDVLGGRHRAKFSSSSQKEVVLLPNVPNPFNPYTQVSFNLPYEGRIDVGVYDVLGRRVRSLVGGLSKPGLHTVIWNGRDNSGRDVASGTYFLRLRFDDRISIRKMLLLR
ncbi:MAG: FlgD immunoglobulin-like domain containing protein [Candidatus Latescibacterota bacterium]|nr:FlgD immunoglobulin-like domain containing protein [Candidatus Latescibacterota bacterium]